MPFAQNGNLRGSERAGVNLAVGLVVYFLGGNGFIVGGVSAEPAIEVNHLCELLYHVRLSTENTGSRARNYLA